MNGPYLVSNTSFISRNEYIPPISWQVADAKVIDWTPYTFLTKGACLGSQNTTGF